MKLGTREACLLVVVLVAVLTRPPELNASQYSIQFKEHLKISNDLKLSGARSSATLRFNSEAAWKPISGSALHLFINHSPDLDGNRSFLSVTLNYGVLRSLRLDEHNQSPTEVAIQLPPEMLKPENEIVFSVEQFPRSGSSREIWTAIQPSSFINIQYEENRPALDLRMLPSPLQARRNGLEEMSPGQAHQQAGVTESDVESLSVEFFGSTIIVLLQRRVRVFTQCSRELSPSSGDPNVPCRVE
jgi:hypothetical protein